MSFQQSLSGQLQPVTRSKHNSLFNSDTINTTKSIALSNSELPFRIRGGTECQPCVVAVRTIIIVAVTVVVVVTVVVLTPAVVLIVLAVVVRVVAVGVSVVVVVGDRFSRGVVAALGAGVSASVSTRVPADRR